MYKCLYIYSLRHISHRITYQTDYARTLDRNSHRFHLFRLETIHYNRRQQDPPRLVLLETVDPQIGGLFVSKVHFRKPALTIEEQAVLLQQRGLQGNREALEITLHRMSYYRFSGYLWWFYTEDQWEVVQEGTTLEDVLELYAFDSALRIYILQFSHSIEIWLRAALTNHIAARHGAMGYLNEDLYVHKEAFSRDLRKLDEMLGKDSPERFVSAFHHKYLDRRPPVWMATELMSLGLLSKWYDNLKEASLRKAIAAEAGLNQHVLSSFLRLFTVLRNGAAHHSRIWNRRTSLRGVTVRNPPPLLRTALYDADESRIHYVLAIATFIIQQVDPSSGGVSSLRHHLLTARDEWLEEMDFPFGFEDDKLWNPNN